jgi:hypothetical protein
MALKCAKRGRFAYSARKLINAYAAKSLELTLRPEAEGAGGLSPGALTPGKLPSDKPRPHKEHGGIIRDFDIGNRSHAGELRARAGPRAFVPMGQQVSFPGF